MAQAKWSPKDPQDIRDYWLNFAPLGLGDGVTLTDATVTIDPDQHDAADPYADLTKVNHAIVGVDGGPETWVRVRTAGGTPAKYAIQYHVTASDGQEYDVTKTLEVKERIIA